MIVSIDTIMCGKQIVLFFGQETFVVVETSKILLLFIYLFIYFFKKGAAIADETFRNWYVNVTKKYLFTLSFYSTSSKYSYNKAQRPKHTCQM